MKKALISKNLKKNQKSDDKDHKVFNFNHYKEFIAKSLDGHWGEVSRLAKAAGCQRSYVSQVVHGTQQLTLDQAFGICRYLKLSATETEYFSLLVQIERAASLNYKQHLQMQASRLKKDHNNISERLNRESLISEDMQSLYFSAWYWCAIHVLTSITDYQTCAAITRKLQLPEETVEYVLKQLEKMGLVLHQKSRWVHSNANIHVARHSPLVQFHHANWRQRALVGSQLATNTNLHFTDVRSISQKDFEYIKSLLLDQLQLIAKIAEPSACEELVGFNLDFYKI